MPNRRDDAADAADVADADVKLQLELSDDDRFKGVDDGDLYNDLFLLLEGAAWGGVACFRGDRRSGLCYCVGGRVAGVSLTIFV